MNPILFLKAVSSVSARALALVALSLMSWVPLAGLMLALSGCSGPSSKGADPAVRLPSTRHSALGGSGPTVASTATFDAPVVDPATWSGSPVGTGVFSVPLSPALSGGPSSIAAVEAGSSGTFYYFIVGDLTAPTGTALAVISDAPFATGTLTLDPAHHYVAAFDTATGDPVAEAQSGTLTLTAAGSAVGARVTGSLSAAFQAIAAPGCTSSSQCAAGQVCLGGSCVASPVCTSNAQCAPGEVCVSGACVAAPGCTSSAQCAAGQVCQRGACVAAPGCTSSAQCAPGQVCQAGACVTLSGCTSSAQCAPGEACQAGRCVATTPPAGCQGLQGSGTLTSSQGALSTCSAVGSASLNLANAVAMVSDSPTGAPAIILLDPASQNQGLELDLNACPAGPGTLNVGAGFDATLYVNPAVSGHVALFAAYQATSGTLTFTQVGATLTGTASLSFDNGGTASATFTVQ